MTTENTIIGQKSQVSVKYDNKDILLLTCLAANMCAIIDFPILSNVGKGEL